MKKRRDLNIADWDAQWTKEELLERLKSFVGKSGAKFEGAVNATVRQVVCRRAVSTSLVTWSWKLSPALAVTRTLSQSEHDARAAGDSGAIAAALADHGRRLTGDGGFVDLGDAIDDFAIRRDDIPRLDEHDAPARSA